MVPDNLWKLELEGGWLPRNDIPPTPRIATWALTWYVQADVNGFTFQRGIELWNAANGIYGLGGANSWWAFNWWLFTWKAIHVASDQAASSTVNFRMGSGGPNRVPLPFQVSVMAWGRSTALRRQVRHWFAGWNTVLLNDSGQISDTWQTPLDQWCRLWFIPQTSGGVTFTPIVWDATGEVARPIESIARLSQFRTIRRRAVDQTAMIRDLGQPGGP